MKTTLILPVLNELSGMKEIMPRINPEWYNQLIIIDGGSTDGSIEYAREKGFFTIVQKREGLRHGYVEALPYISGDIVITFSPDGNSIPERIPALIKKMEEGYDMVIVSRYRDEARSYDDDLLTAFGNWMFTRVINLLFRAKYTDTMVMFRAYRKNLIYELELHKDYLYAIPERIFHTVISWEPILSVKCAKKKLKVAEIPGDEPERIGGVRKLKPFKWGAAYLWQIIREFIIFWD